MSVLASSVRSRSIRGAAWIVPWLAFVACDSGGPQDAGIDGATQTPACQCEIISDAGSSGCGAQRYTVCATSTDPPMPCGPPLFSCSPLDATAGAYCCSY